MKTKIHLIVIVALLSGCATGPSPEEVARARQQRESEERARQQEIQREVDAWSLAQNSDSYDSYESYLKSYPSSSNSGEAKRLLISHEKSKARDSFRILSATRTNEEQPFRQGVTLSGSGTKELPYQVATPLEGDTFIIMEWDLGDFIFQGKEFIFKGSDLVIYSEEDSPDEGYVLWPVFSSEGAKMVWQGASGSSSTVTTGKSLGGNRLFVIKKGSHNIKVRFLGREYPVNIETN